MCYIPRALSLLSTSPQTIKIETLAWSYAPNGYALLDPGPTMTLPRVILCGGDQIPSFVSISVCRNHQRSARLMQGQIPVTWRSVTWKNVLMAAMMSPAMGVPYTDHGLVIGHYRLRQTSACFADITSSNASLCLQVISYLG